MMEPVVRKRVEYRIDPAWKPLKATADEWLDSVAARRSSRTSYVYRNTVEFFIKVCPKAYLHEITRKNITDWLLALKVQGNAERTIYNYAGYMRTFFRWSGFPDLIRGNEDMPAYTEKCVTAYSAEDLRAMMSVATPPELLLLQFLVGTGFREPEAMYAYFEDVDFAGRKIRVRKKPEFGFRVKDKEERSIPIPNALCLQLQARRAANPGQRLIFPTSNGKPDGHMLMKIKRLHLRAGLNCGYCVNKAGKCCNKYPVCEKAELHKTRKSFATLLSQSGVPPQTISKYLGHSDLQTTLRYLEAADLSVEQQNQLNKTFALLEAA